MHLSIFSVLAVLVATLHATPTPANLSLRKEAKSVNDCSDSSFENQWSEGSPLVEDCKALMVNIAGGGTWTHQHAGSQRTFVKYKSCAFGGTSSGKNLWVKVGNQDVIDVITESINRFQKNGKVGSKGYMHCQNGSGAEKPGGDVLEWGLYVPKPPAPPKPCCGKS